MQQQTTTVNDDGTETESAKKTNDYFIMDERQLPIAVVVPDGQVVVVCTNSHCQPW